MRFIDLFAGIGGFHLGVTKVKQARCVYANEWDKNAAQIYKKHFGEIDTRDITTVPAGEIPKHDLLCGGFPCQAFSVAGKRRGFEETRGTLFFEIMRIARYHKTPYLLLENVKGLLNHDGGATFRTILESLDELGYDCQWQVLNSRLHGVPQNRERVFIVGHLRGRPRPQVFPIGPADQAAPPPGEPASRREKVFIKTRNLGRNGDLMSVDSPTGFDSAGEQDIATAVDANYHKGHGQRGTSRGRTMVKQQNPKAPQDLRMYDKDGLSPTINPAAAAGGAVIPKIKVGANTKKGYDEAAPGDSVNFSVPNSKTRRGRVGKGVAQTIDTGAQQGVVDGSSRIRRLTPVECERLQGFPDGFTEGVSDTQRYHALGNAVSVPVVSAVARRLI